MDTKSPDTKSLLSRNLYHIPTFTTTVHEYYVSIVDRKFWSCPVEFSVEEVGLYIHIRTYVHTTYTHTYIRTYIHLNG